MAKRYDNEKILVFGDLHLPYHAEEAFDFLSDATKKFKPTRVVCVGDLVDFYSASRFPKSPDHKDSFVSEIRKIKKGVKDLSKIFPKLLLCMGNHDDRYAIRVATSGLPSEMMKDFGNVVGAPKSWKIYKSTVDLNLTIDSTRESITFAHNRGANTHLIAQRLGRTFVAGHSHTKGQVVGFNNGKRTFFGVNNPCLISNEGSPFAYAKISNINPVRGITLIEGGVPRMILM